MADILSAVALCGNSVQRSSSRTQDTERSGLVVAAEGGEQIWRLRQLIVIARSTANAVESTYTGSLPLTLLGERIVEGVVSKR